MEQQGAKNSDLGAADLGELASPLHGEGQLDPHSGADLPLPTMAAPLDNDAQQSSDNVTSKNELCSSSSGAVHKSNIRSPHLSSRRVRSALGSSDRKRPRDDSVNLDFSGGADKARVLVGSGVDMLRISPTFVAVRSGPTSCLVECGSARGHFDLMTERITCFCKYCVREGGEEGCEVIPSEFERHGGMSACKKWRFSIKVGALGGTAGTAGRQE